MRCTEEGCDEKVLARGLCGRHYKAWQRQGKPAGPAMAPPHVPSPCTVTACDENVYSRALCERHHRQVLRTGTTRPDASATPTCSIPACTRSSEARGWCHGHYLRWSRTGSTLSAKPLQREEPKTCSLPGCERTHQARGLCLPHYQRFLATGSARSDEPIRRIKGTGFIQRGYRIVPVAEEQRWLTDGATQVAEHRLVLARALGRPLAATKASIIATATVATTGWPTSSCGAGGSRRASALKTRSPGLWSSWRGTRRCCSRKASYGRRRARPREVIVGFLVARKGFEPS
ncbi:MAG: hypothetical protein JWL79_1887 [Frankiales bacterium]|nr:hypothetical protein [Frankiales bacterium]